MECRDCTYSVLRLKSLLSNHAITHTHTHKREAQNEVKRHHVIPQWKLIGFCNETSTYSQSCTYTNLSNLLHLLSWRERTRGKASITARPYRLHFNSDASCDDSLMGDNWKTVIWTRQFWLTDHPTVSTLVFPSP